MNETLFVITGLLIRIGLPVLFTAIVVVLLRKMDEHWQAESRHLPVAAMQKPCWETKGCSPEKRAQCAACESGQPCWQVFRAADGTLKEECLACDVFIQAPIPA